MNKVLICLVLFFLFFGNSNANEKKVLWKVKKISTDSPKKEIELEANISPNYFLYDSLSNLKEVSGVQFVSPLDLKIINKKLSITKVKDFFFTKKLIQCLQGKNTWLFQVPSNISLQNQICVIQYTVFNEVEFLQESDTLEIVFNQNEVLSNPLLIPSINIQKPLFSNASFGSIKTSENSKLMIFVLGFLSGLIALLTPCVFPMIPLTISFFGKKSVSKKQSVSHALLYGLSIIIIYLLVGVPFHLLDNINPDFLNNLATNIYLNAFFFLMMIVFGISFLGFFDIQLPDKFANFSDSKSNIQNKTGIFFMAFTLCIVSFSCTGPILGTLLANSLSSNNGAWNLTWGLLGFGVGMGIPFTLLAFFPNLLKKLPRSGNWMSEFKKFLAVLEFALAFKFLSNVDLVMHWGILKREVFLGIWALLSLGYAIYLLNFKTFFSQPFYSVKKIGGILFLLFGIYLSVGVSKKGYENIQAFSWLSNGILPPHFYSFYALENECPLSLNCVKDYEEAIVLAKKLNKPILIDFTGWSCVNCRKMEENVWTNPEVEPLLRNHFILTSLYIDDRTKLTQPFYIQFQNQKKKIETIGDKYTYFQLLNFNNNAQPLYAILNTQQELLLPPIAYTPHPQEYKRWLVEGLKAFEKKP